MAFYKPHKKQRQNYVPPYDKELLSKPVADLNISDALKEVLINGFVTDLCAIVKRNEREIFGVKFFNKKHLTELKKELTALGVDFRQDPREPEGSLSEKSEKEEAFRQQSSENISQNSVKNRDIDSRKANKPIFAENGKNRTKEIFGDRAKASASTQKQAKPALKPAPVAARPAGPLTEADWTKYTRNGRWGYIDPSTNRIKIQPVYDEIFAFKEGLACAEKSDLFGYIDVDSNVVIPFEYELGMSFKEGLACVTKNNKTGFIDKEGTVVIDFRFEAAMSFEDGVARVKEDGKWVDIDKNGVTVKVY
ncbi:MAG: WG repeat-containing protein [Clostridiales bacterium]|jgi:hypothetical protein|nr:WG repeat-containing protein [Clostridiales bacterium]